MIARGSLFRVVSIFFVHSSPFSSFYPPGVT
jgi:hypothetical protein